MCGITGVIGTQWPVQLALCMLESIEQRGNGEGAGVTISMEQGLESHRIVGSPYLLQRTLPFSNRRAGVAAIAHHRYGTSGVSQDTLNVQPFVRNVNGWTFALAHNGSVPNCEALRQALPAVPGFDATSDSELFGLFIAQENATDFVTAVKNALRRLSNITENEAAYSLLIMTRDTLIAACDPRKHRPLAFGAVGGGWAFASETSALDAVKTENISEIDGGEIVVVHNGMLTRERFAPCVALTSCVVETIYLSRPSSQVFGNSETVRSHRRQVGARLALRYQPSAERDTTIVVPVPESALALAEGYAGATELPLVQAILKSSSAGRSFLQPTQTLRKAELPHKFTFLPHLIVGKHVILVDDSVIRGTTMQFIAARVTECGAASVVILSGLPQVRNECHKGVFIRKDEGVKPLLISLIHGGDPKSMARELGVRHIVFSEIDDMSVIGNGLCLDCLKA